MLPIIAIFTSRAIIDIIQIGMITYFNARDCRSTSSSR